MSTAAQTQPIHEAPPKLNEAEAGFVELLNQANVKIRDLNRRIVAMEKAHLRRKYARKLIKECGGSLSRAIDRVSCMARSTVSYDERARLESLKLCLETRSFE